MRTWMWYVRVRARPHIHLRTRCFDPAAEGTYGLFDAGMGLVQERVLVPYRTTRYHLQVSCVHQGQGVRCLTIWQEFGTDKPRTAKELFNLRHSSLRSRAVECAFGILKGKWRILSKGVDAHSVSHACSIIMACFHLHNFVGYYDGMIDGR